MIEFGGIYYYLDIEALEKIVNIENKPNDYDVSHEITTKEIGGSYEKKHTEIKLPKTDVNVIKYDILRNCIDIILESDDQGDSALGAEAALEKMPLSYKVAFNTLYKYEIIKEQE